ncbi:hypothetical protein B5F27_12050 [Faecalibacterium sp. An192]|nr:hypothetical protein B5F27_12050 [Faecalibacterium sp. An192]
MVSYRDPKALARPTVQAREPGRMGDRTGRLLPGAQGLAFLLHQDHRHNQRNEISNRAGLHHAQIEMKEWGKRGESQPPFARKKPPFAAISLHKQELCCILDQKAGPFGPLWTNCGACLPPPEGGSQGKGACYDEPNQ